MTVSCQISLCLPSAFWVCGRAIIQNEHNFHSYRMWDTSWRIIRRVGRRAVVGHFGRMDQVWYGKRSVYRKDCSSARGVGRGKIKASNLRRMGL